MIAHVKPEGEGFRTQEYKDHAEGVAALCSAFAANLTKNGQWSSTGYMLGLLHDVGKLHPGFQRYIRYASGMSSRPAEHVAHSATGALFARTLCLDPRLQRLAEYCIASHHRGLYNFNDLRNRLDADPAVIDSSAQVKQSAPQELEWTWEQIQKALPENPVRRSCDADDYPMIVRMLFSCLVDADYLDTEQFMQNKARAHTSVDFVLLRDKLRQKTEAFKADTPINQARATFLNRCRAHGSSCSRGIYSLFLPTGGGKTLSSMAWALESAIRLKASRIIYVIPYTSIITQTAQQFRKIFGGENVLEHHSDLDIADLEEYNRTKLLAENWDAPIVVTTNVQLFESVYAHRVSRCRKLHNIARAVLVFDEVQMFPSEHLNPMVRAIESLCSAMGTQTLLCTATQPVLTEELSDGFRQSAHPFEPLAYSVEEVVPYNPELFSLFDRAEYHITSPLSLSADELARELEAHESALCIVNTRRAAALVYCALRAQSGREDRAIVHLSRMMCSAHLKEKLNLIKERLAGGLPTLVVSTQLIEAGVDLDFPVVYRQQASLVSVIQAGGRCNREGKRAQKGQVYVFTLQDGKEPFGEIKTGIQATQDILPELSAGTQVHDPDLISNYYRQFYRRIGDFDRGNVCSELLHRTGDPNLLRYDFEEASRQFRLVEDKSSCDVFVPYNAQSKELLHLLERGTAHRQDLRLLQQYRVAVSPALCSVLLREGMLTPSRYGRQQLGAYILRDEGDYDSDLGLLSESHWNNQTLWA